VAVPTSTGNAAAATADSGATTAIRPAANPAKIMTLPAALPAPARIPHESMAPLASPRLVVSRAPARTAAAAWLVAATAQALARRERTPPTKSESP